MIYVLKKILRENFAFIYKILFKIYHLDENLMNCIAKSNRLSSSFYSGRKKHISSKHFDLVKNSNFRELQSHILIEAGPFAGMLYGGKSGTWFDPCESLIQKKFGTYEQEVLEFITNQKWSVFIDIGAGTGYYSIGMLKFDYCKFAVLFESNLDYRPFIVENAKLNGLNVDKLVIDGKSNAREIISQFDEVNISDKTNSLLLCDIEGFENELFDLNFLEDLARRDITLCIEIHKAQYFKYGNKEDFTLNLKKYFDINVFSTMKRDLTKVFLDAPLVHDRWLLASEGRSEGCQILCVPKIHKNDF
jgi:hypothetical protein